MSKRLVLFDVDGTLVSTNGHSVRAMHESYEAIWGVPTAQLDFRMDGKTDLAICYELLDLAGVPRERVTERLPAFWAHYATALERNLSGDRITVLPGVHALVRAVDAHPDMLLGLLTGNIEAGAALKMRLAGLTGFQLGAYGQDHEQREALPPVAVERARELTGWAFTGKDVVIIGDTPLDVACGRAVGARSLAVATGRYAAEELAATEPHAVFETLADVPRVMDAILVGA